MHGTLRTVGRDAAERAQPGPGVASTGAVPAAGASDAPPTYPAKVALAQDWIAVDGRHERLQPGMRVAAEIKTGDRR